MTATLFDTQIKKEYIQEYHWNINDPPQDYYAKFGNSVDSVRLLLKKYIQLPPMQSDSLYELLFTIPAEDQIILAKNKYSVKDMEKINKYLPVDNKLLELLHKYVKMDSRDKLTFAIMTGIKI